MVYNEYSKGGAMMDRYNKEFGNRMYNARKAKGLTMKELGKIVGLHESTINRYERGEIKSLDIEKAKEFAKALDISEAYLMGWQDEKRDSEPIPLLGTIAAGAPLLAEEHIEDYFNLDSSIDADFALRVRGDSMLGAGIFPGDVAFLRKQPVLENGEIGAILIENEATLKKFYEDNGTVILQAENDKYQPMILTNGYVKVLGKLVAVLSMR